MSFSLVVQYEAILDIQEAFIWYEQKKQGLGFSFIEEIESGYQKITTQPLHYLVVNQRFRRLKVSRFPYLIIYEIEGDTIIVNSVRYTGRKPIA